MNKKRRNLLVILFFLFLNCIFFFPIFKGLVPFPGDLLIAHYNPWSKYSFLGYVPGTFPNKAQYFDTLRQIYPWKIFSIEKMKNWELPFWNPYNFSGAPLLANHQSAVFYPLNILYFLFSPINAWIILVFLQPFLAAFFTYLFSRKIGIKKEGALLAGIVFGFCGFMSVFLQYNTIGHTILWLPLILYFIEVLREKFSLFSFLGLPLAITFSFFAGHLPSFGFLLGFVIVYCFFRLKNLFQILKILLLILFSLGLVAFQALPTWELIFHSARDPHSYSQIINTFLFQPKQLVMLIIPDFFGNPATNSYFLNDTYVSKVSYVGLISLIFALYSLFWFKKSQFIKFFSLSSLVILIFLINSPLTKLFYKLELPLFSTSSPTNMIFLISFSFAILSGFGFEFWKNEINKRKKFWPLGLFLGFFLAIWLLAIIRNFPPVTIRNLAYSTIIFLGGIFLLLGFYFLKKKAFLFALIFLAAADLFYFFRKFNPFVSPSLVFPQTEITSWLQEKGGIDRFWGYGAAGIEANFATYFKIFSPEGYDPLYPRWYGEFIYLTDNGKFPEKFEEKTRSDAIVAPGFGEENFVSNFYRRRILDLLGVKYILDRQENGSTQKTFPPSDFDLVFEKQGWRVFKNKKSLPRIFLISDYKIYKNKEEFLELFFAPNFKPEEYILLEKESSVKPRAGGKEYLKLVKYSSNLIEVEAETEFPKMLFISDTYYPGWKAFIDGKETEIYKAFWAFRAISVTPGFHKIVFKYIPPLFNIGVKISITSGLLIITWMFLIWKKRQNCF
jgi:hypothetical protein